MEWFRDESKDAPKMQMTLCASGVLFNGPAAQYIAKNGMVKIALAEGQVIVKPVVGDPKSDPEIVRVIKHGSSGTMYRLSGKKAKEWLESRGLKSRHYPAYWDDKHGWLVVKIA